MEGQGRKRKPLLYHTRQQTDSDDASEWPHPRVVRDHLGGMTISEAFDAIPNGVWNATEQKSPEARSGLSLAPSRCTPFRTIRDGIRKT